MNTFQRFMASVFGGFFDKRLWAQSPGAARTTTAKVDVSEESALNYAAVWCATRLLCGTGASLPFPIYSGKDDDTRVKMREHPVYRLLNTAPNPEMTAYNFRSVMWQWQVNWGNAFAEIVREGNNPEAPVMELWPLHPNRVKVCRDDGGSLFYEVSNFGGEPTELDPWRMLHIPSIITYDGIVGHGVIQHARETIGAGLAAEKAAAHSFGGGKLPAVVVEHQGKLNDDVRSAFRKEWKELYTSPDGDEVALLGGGAVAKPMPGISEKDRQFLETRQFDIEEIARWYGVSPHLLQHLLRATFNNIEELGIDFVRYGIGLWLEIWEQTVAHKLFTPKEQESLFAEHNVDALLRGNAAARASFYQVMINAALMNRNECRKLENLDPVDGGDVFLVQGATVPLDEDGKPESQFVNGGEPAALPAPEPNGDDSEDSRKLEEIRAELAEAKTLISQCAVLNQEAVIFKADQLAAKIDEKAESSAAVNEALREMVKSLVELHELHESANAERSDVIDKGLEKNAEQIEHNRQVNIKQADAILEASGRIRMAVIRCLNKVLHRESREIRGHAENPQAFSSLVEKFYSEQEKVLKEEFSELFAALASLMAVDSEAVIRCWVSSGKQSALVASERAKTTKDVQASIKHLTESPEWQHRPLRALMEGENATLVV